MSVIQRTNDDKTISVQWDGVFGCLDIRIRNENIFSYNTLDNQFIWYNINIIDDNDKNIIYGLVKDIVDKNIYEHITQSL
jgi:hypothetical protein